MLSQEQAQQIKKQLTQQIQENFPEERKKELINLILSMNEKELEEFLIKNNLIKKNQECILCSIVKNQIPSFKVGENKEAIAVLEINPISKAHTLVIPKKHIKREEFPEEIYSLAKEISKEIKRTFNPKEVIIFPSSLFDHSFLNVLPIYTTETPESERKKITQEELKKIQEKLNEKIQETKEIPKEKKEEKKEIINDKNTWLPKRIP